MRNQIESELGTVFYYRGHKFTSMKDALECKDFIKSINNEEELGQEWKNYTKEKKLKLIEKLWKEK